MSYESPIHRIPSRCTLKFHHWQHIHSKAIMGSVVMRASDIRTYTVGAGSKEILKERMSLLTQGFVGMISDSLCFRARKKLCQSFLKLFPLFIGLSPLRHPKSCKKKMLSTWLQCSRFNTPSLLWVHTSKSRDPSDVCHTWEKVFRVQKLLGEHQRGFIT